MFINFATPQSYFFAQRRVVVERVMENENLLHKLSINSNTFQNILRLLQTSAVPTKSEFKFMTGNDD